jgi:hypothetical protein
MSAPIIPRHPTSGISTIGRFCCPRTARTTTPAPSAAIAGFLETPGSRKKIPIRFDEGVIGRVSYTDNGRYTAGADWAEMCTHFHHCTLDMELSHTFRLRSAAIQNVFKIWTDVWIASQCVQRVYCKPWTKHEKDGSREQLPNSREIPQEPLRGCSGGAHPWW